MDHPANKSCSTIGEGEDTTILSPGRSPIQPLPRIGLHDPLHGRQACLESNLFHQGVVKYVPGRDYFRAVSSQDGEKFVISPPPSIVERVTTAIFGDLISLMLLTTQFSGQGAKCGTDFDMSRRNNSTNKSNNHSQGLDHHVESTEFDSIRHHVKKGKRGACRHKAATVLPGRTAAT